MRKEERRKKIVLERPYAIDDKYDGILKDRMDCRRGEKIHLRSKETPKNFDVLTLPL